jgi:hypothetical protein
MSIRNSAIALLLLSGAAHAQTQTNFYLAFDEEFTELSISDSLTYDGKRWYTQTHPCCMQPNPAALSLLWPNFPPGPPDPGTVSPFSLTGGTGPGLQIRLSKQTPTGGPNAGHPVWYGGQIATLSPDGKGFSQQYGYFEMKAKLPPGTGTWPGFWMVSVAGHTSNLARSELDMYETFGAFDTGPGGSFNATYHDWNTGTQLWQHNIVTGDLTTAYHVYGLLWTEQQITGFFDGKAVWQEPTPEEMKQPHFFLITLGMGGGFSTAGTTDPSDQQVQYFRAYKIIGTVIYQ